jgi:bifunctional non-homologous end joining protein LigD
MGLAEYRRKRRFDRTPEPRGGEGKSVGRLRYVIQKHAARRLHYDFRLELDGVLKSWAVPKGPSLDPKEKRLAVETEDHPIEYGDFEGVIPEKQYGAGHVLLWDRGHWEPIGDAAAGYRKGKLDFTLAGEKLRGRWHLVRIGGAAARGKDWLLIKGRDDAADPERDIVADEPRSVVSGVTIDEIPQVTAARWDSDRADAADGEDAKQARGRAARKPKAARPRKSFAELVRDLPGARRGGLQLPDTVQLATAVKTAPRGPGWIHEMKLDGYRLLCSADHGVVRWTSRNGKDWSKQLQRLSPKVAALPARSFVLDGELVKLTPDGKSSFQALQNALDFAAQDELDYYAFDLLHLDGWDLADVPLEQRKHALRELIPRDEAAAHGVRYCEHMEGDGPVIRESACKLGLEGIVSKRRDQPYRPGRGRDWQKCKCQGRQEMIIGGWTDPKGARTGIGALLLGVRRDDGDLVFCGKVGTGFTEQSLRMLRERLDALATAESPFAPGSRGLPRAAHWVQPKLVCEVEFTEWTSDGRLRHPSFLGLRVDKPAAEVRRERPVDGARASPGEGRGGASGARTSRGEGRGGASAPATAAAPRRGVSLAGIKLTHPGRVFWPEQGITKQELAAYYAAIAERMLPYVVRRPLALVRCPEGIAGECFFQKHAMPGLPAAIKRTKVKGKDGKEEVLYVEDAAGLIALAQMGVLEIHTWGSTLDHLEQPDVLIFDLDPDPTAPWGQVVDGATTLRATLRSLGLASFVKTTGGKGLHVVVPCTPELEWERVKSFTQVMSEQMAANDPKRYTAKLPKAQRHGKVFVDYLRNGRGATAIAPFSTRARPGAPVATPVGWSEIGKVRPDQFTLHNLAERLAKLKSDPWRELATTEQSLVSSVQGGR